MAGRQRNGAREKMLIKSGQEIKEGAREGFRIEGEGERGKGGTTVTCCYHTSSY